MMKLLNLIGICAGAALTFIGFQSQEIVDLVFGIFVIIVNAINLVR